MTDLKRRFNFFLLLTSANEISCSIFGGVGSLLILLLFLNRDKCKPRFLIFVNELTHLNFLMRNLQDHYTNWRVLTIMLHAQSLQAPVQDWTIFTVLQSSKRIKSIYFDLIQVDFLNKNKIKPRMKRDI
jgi:hypothetical protein